MTSLPSRCGFADFPAPEVPLAASAVVIEVTKREAAASEARRRLAQQALVADLVPSRWRSLATGSVTFQMCVGAIVFLMPERALGMRTAFLVARATVQPGVLGATRQGVAERRADHALDPDERYTFGAFANYEISSGLKPYLEVMFMDDRSVAQIAPSGNFFNTLNDHAKNGGTKTWRPGFAIFAPLR